MWQWISNVLDHPEMPSYAHVVRIIAALVLGGLIGLERELRDKPAGFRTIMLICVGACLFTIASSSVAGADPTRIAAQVVSGIGFLGAGAIIRGTGGVFGLTTAATIWAVAAVGVAIGFGHLALALLGTVAILASLFAFDALERMIAGLREVQEYRIASHRRPDAPETLDELFRKGRLKPLSRTYYEDGESIVFRVHVMGTKGNHERMRKQIVFSDSYTLRMS